MKLFIVSTILSAGMLLSAADKEKSAKQDKSATEAEMNSVSQQRIIRQVRHELVMLPFYGVFDNFSYKVNGDTVTLLGEVTRPTLKTSAGRVVQAIEGVTKVDNQIEVLPLSPMDDGVRLAVYRSIYGHASLNRYALRAVPPIHIIVKNGHVTLKGAVATEADKNIANIQASSVANVFSVKNELVVDNGN